MNEEINSNMGCIEMSAGVKYSSPLRLINSNMGCIEMAIEVVDPPDVAAINSNMGCIEICNLKSRMEGCAR